MSAQKICPQCNTEYPPEQLFCPKDGSTLKSLGGAADLVGSIIQKVYHVKKKLGEGGMGTVYLAEHVKMGRKSALKVMNPGMVHDADAISRFNREAANASKISHPNVAAVYDFGETEDGLIFLAMEFIEGPSLTKVIEDAGFLPAHRAAEITRQASEALSVAHDMGIVHRDLKPDNIMLAKGREGADVVKVVDFGIAKAGADEGQKVTKTGMVVGTPEYMSPEQLSGDKLDGRSDTYSLALVAFNMMTGKLPFPGATSQETMIARLMENPRQLSEMKPEIPWTAEVQAVMDRALARASEDRYQTAAEFGRELFAAVQTMPTTADVTSAHTAVMAPASVPKTAAEPRPKPVPATRVGTSPPMPNTAAVPAVTKSRTGLYGSIGSGVLVVGALVAYMALKGGGEPSGNANDTKLSKPLDTTPASAPAATVVNLARELEDAASMPDSTEALARAILAKLQPLDSIAHASDNTSWSSYRFLRGKALINTGDQKAGCDSLKRLEGALKGTIYERSSKVLLGAC